MVKLVDLVAEEVIEEVDKTSDNTRTKQSLKVDKITTPDCTAGFVINKATMGVCSHVLVSHNLSQEEEMPRESPSLSASYV